MKTDDASTAENRPELSPVQARKVRVCSVDDADETRHQIRKRAESFPPSRPRWGVEISNTQGTDRKRRLSLSLWAKTRRPGENLKRKISFLGMDSKNASPEQESDLDLVYAASAHGGDEEKTAELDSPVDGSVKDPVSNGDKFEPVDLDNEPYVDSGLPPELWTIIQSAHASFTPQYFLEVSRNLLENPNITASHLARAELSYSSFTDATFNPRARHPHELARVIKHLKPDHQPLLVPDGYPGYSLEWTVVRKLIPRNPKLDKPLIQTCHLFTSTARIIIKDKGGRSEEVDAERYLVVYLPHVTDHEEIPFYHPKVQALAILYTFQSKPSLGTPVGRLSIFYNLFAERPLDNRMSRTALKMLEIIHKHSRGRMAGYQKRVHHDVIIAQKPFQDTYAHLKGKYAKSLIDNWVEQTPAEKHVFEDLGIAAFLIELWTDMWGGKREERPQESDGRTEKVPADATNEDSGVETEQQRRLHAQQKFPGFVDIGCGNGLLVWILSEEGWSGWGFDARRRKTWDTFGTSYSEKLQAMLLVPEVLSHNRDTSDDPPSAAAEPIIPTTHNGIFPNGTFIISNHADELTVWTPLLAFLSESPFLAIPCCSHNFGGARFRAPSRPSKSTSSTPSSPSSKPPSSAPAKPPSAYATLCTYISHLTTHISYIPEKEHLRIPSTRNVAIVGREKANKGCLMGNLDDKLGVVREIVEREMGGLGIESVRGLWVERGEGLRGREGGH